MDNLHCLFGHKMPDNSLGWMWRSRTLDTDLVGTFDLISYFHLHEKQPTRVRATPRQSQFFADFREENTH
jgi:hypothetical protein